ncbi:MAG: hypothetical protein SPL52_03610 [Fibrobacter sp.]|nr:hypothetical protein [Fibrobacter sp.]
MKKIGCFVLIAMLFVINSNAKEKKLIDEFESWVKQIEKIKKNLDKGKIDTTTADAELREISFQGRILGGSLKQHCNAKSLSEKDCESFEKLKERTCVVIPKWCR